MTKDEILERYLNTVYFGNGAYGVQAAAETYFGKSVGELDWAEAALLAALIRHPTATTRSRTPSWRSSGAASRCSAWSTRPPHPGGGGPVRVRAAADRAGAGPPAAQRLLRRRGQAVLLDDPRLGATPTDRYNAVFKGGLQIYTTFDPGMQFAALTARNDVLPGDEFGQFEIPTRDGRAAGRLPRAGGGHVVRRRVRAGVGRATTAPSGRWSAGPGSRTTSTTSRRGATASRVVVQDVRARRPPRERLRPDDTVNGSAPCSIPNPGGIPEYTANNAEGSGGAAARSRRRRPAR